MICILAPGEASGEYEAPIMYFPCLKGCIPVLECMRSNPCNWLCPINCELKRKERQKVKLLRRGEHSWSAAVAGKVRKSIKHSEALKEGKNVKGRVNSCAKDRMSESIRDKLISV